MASRQKHFKVCISHEKTIPSLATLVKFPFHQRGELPPVCRTIWPSSDSFAGLSHPDTLLLSDASETNSSRAKEMPFVINAKVNFKLSRQTGLCLLMYLCIM